MKRAFAGLLAAGAVASAAAALATTASAADPQPKAERVLELASPQQSGGFNVSGWGWPDGQHSVYKLGLLDVNARTGTSGSGGAWSFGALQQVLPKVSSVLLDGADDFSTKVVYEQQLIPIAGQPEGMYVYNPDGSVSTVAQWTLADSLDPAAAPRTVTYRGGSADARTLYFQATPGILAPSASGLYRWHDGATVPLVLDDGRPPECEAGAVVGGSASGYVSLGQTGVSDDGATVVISTAAGCRDAGGVDHFRHVLVWKDGETIDLTEPVAGAADGNAEYKGSSPDGSIVYVTTATKLVAGDGNGVADLYAFDLRRGDVTRISQSGGADDANVTSAIVAPGGAAVWFVTANPLDGEGAPNSDNLFQWTASGGVRHVLTAQASTLTMTAGPSSGASEVSADGSTLVMSTMTADLVPNPTGGYPRLYRIAAGGAIDCVSCTGDSAFSSGSNRLTVPPGTNGGLWGAPSVSADGSTVLFESNTPFDPADRNDAVDAYLWRDGANTLLSSGTQAGDANAAGLSADGRSAFFTSFGALLPGTRDPYSKLYVARIGQSPPPAPPAPCAGDACQGPSVAPPALPAPLSESFEGKGNVTPAAPVAFAPRWPGRAGLTRLARGGTLKLTVTGHGAGRIGATVQARIGGAWVQVATAAKPLSGKGTATLSLKLSRQARRQLAAGRSLRIRVTVRASRVAAARSATFLLRGTRKAAAKRVAKGR